MDLCQTMLLESKKIRTSGKDQVDRLSDLPECLILHILSLMDLKTAIQTCILSKRWKDLWKSLPRLNFDSESFEKLTPFKKFVVNVLSGCKPNGLTSLRFCQTSRDQSFTHRVLRYAALHGVREVSLGDHYELNISHFLRASKWLRTIELHNCKLGETQCFESLSRCANLETLSIIRCLVFSKEIKISAPNLVDLTLAGLRISASIGKYKLLLSAPRLSMFFFNGAYPLDLSMDGCPVLKRIGIMLHDPSWNAPNHVQAYLSHMKVLLQRVCFYSQIAQIRFECWTAISIRLDGLVGAKIFNPQTQGAEDISIWNLKRQLLIQTDMIDIEKLIREFSEKKTPITLLFHTLLALS